MSCRLNSKKFGLVLDVICIDHVGVVRIGVGHVGVWHAVV